MGLASRGPSPRERSRPALLDKDVSLAVLRGAGERLEEQRDGDRAGIAHAARDLTDVARAPAASDQAGRRVRPARAAEAAAASAVASPSSPRATPAAPPPPESSASIIVLSPGCAPPSRWTASRPRLGAGRELGDVRSPARCRAARESRGTSIAEQRAARAADVHERGRRATPKTPPGVSVGVGCEAVGDAIHRRQRGSMPKSPSPL